MSAPPPIIFTVTDAGRQAALDALNTGLTLRLTHIACAMVQAGAGIAIVDELAVAGRVWPDVVVRPINPRTTMPLHMLHSNVVPVSQLAHDFMEVVISTASRGMRAGWA